MISSVCAQVETAFRDVERSDFLSLPPPIFFSLCLHRINAFGYRPNWAEVLFPYIQFDPQDRPYFPAAPETPEAHRHKFLCALALSENSPGAWKLGHHSLSSEDFVAPILEMPVELWGDRSLVPEPSWTLQFLSAFVERSGGWQGRENPFATVLRGWWETYFKDFASGALWEPGRTPFTETGLHFLEAVNKICLKQVDLGAAYFSAFKQHLWTRLLKSTEDNSILLSNPDWMEQGYRHRVLEIAVSQLLISGHLLEVCFHPQGALRATWQESEMAILKNAAQGLADLMKLFFNPKILGLMNAEQSRGYPFPLLHAYHALALSGLRNHSSQP